MLACVDVDYREEAAVNQARDGKKDTKAVVACLLFDRWEAAEPADAHVAVVEKVAAYIPGEFYRRELPCLMEVLRPVLDRITTVVVDSYVWLPAAEETSPEAIRLLCDWQGGESTKGAALPIPVGRRPGMRAWLFRELEGKTPVVGVAKTAFHGAGGAFEVLRGASKNPLFVTAVGIDIQTAAEHVRNMHGEHRFPSLLKRVDRLTRTAKVRPGAPA